MEGKKSEWQKNHRKRRIQGGRGEPWFSKDNWKRLLLTNVRILFTEPLNANNIFLNHQKRPSGSVVKYSRSKIQKSHLKRKRYESST